MNTGPYPDIGKAFNRAPGGLLTSREAGNQTGRVVA